MPVPPPGPRKPWITSNRLFVAGTIAVIVFVFWLCYHHDERTANAYFHHQCVFESTGEVVRPLGYLNGGPSVDCVVLRKNGETMIVPHDLLTPFGPELP